MKLTFLIPLFATVSAIQLSVSKAGDASDDAYAKAVAAMEKQIAAINAHNADVFKKFGADSDKTAAKPAKKDDAKKADAKKADAGK